MRSEATVRFLRWPTNKVSRQGEARSTEEANRLNTQGELFEKRSRLIARAAKYGSHFCVMLAKSRSRTLAAAIRRVFPVTLFRRPNFGSPTI